jgi:phosphoglycolate phosphatase-like HAD superfamily hydrolase
VKSVVSISANSWKLDGVSAILFDKDGTFVDSHQYWGKIIFHRSQAICEAFQMDSSCIERLEVVMGFSRVLGRLLPAGPIALVSRDEVIEFVTQYLLTQNMKASKLQISEIFERVHREMEKIDEHIRLIPEALPLFKSLKEKGVKLAVVTTDAIKNTEMTLEKLGLQSYFSAIVGRESCKEPKASGVPATIALSKLGISAQESICVGDAPMDMQMASKSGCQACIGVATGQVSESDLRKVTPYVVSSLSQLSVV